MVSIPNIYWDTSCFICFLNRDEADRRKICEDILQHAQKNEVRIHTSTYTIAEVIKPKKKDLPNSRKLTPTEIEKIQGMFRWRWLSKIDVDQRVAFKAVELSRDFGMSPADAVHAATAIIWKLDAIQYWDRGFKVVEHLIPCEVPQMISTQTILSILEPPRIGPHPDDFEDTLYGPSA